MKLMLVLMQPAAPLIEALCDRTCELARELPHVESARLLRRHVQIDGRVIRVQHWRARAEVPALLRPHLEEGLRDWTLTLDHLPGASVCHWHAESAAVQVPGRCTGELVFRPAAGGRGTRIELGWAFAARQEGLRSIFGTLLANHWRALAEAAAREVARASEADPVAGSAAPPAG